GSGYDPQEIALLLAKLLEEPSIKVQAAALSGLAKLGKEAKATVPLVHKFAQTTSELSKDKKEPDLRLRAVAALGAVGPAAQEAAPLLLSWLAAAKAEDMRGQLIEALGLIESKEAVKVLEPLIGKEKGSEGVQAALALWRINRS